jgi:ABC-type molybdate transport system substrate-binding protein
MAMAGMIMGGGTGMAQTPPAPSVEPPSSALNPPWQHGRNNDAVVRGVEFTIPDIDVLADFHGVLNDPKLVLYVGGNYFFAMAPLVEAFERLHPHYKGRLFWETLPPGILAQQIRAGGTITVGNMTWTVKPDIYLAGLSEVKGLISEGILVGPPTAYATNTLTIMVPKGNPARIRSLTDLSRPGLRLAMPNPQFEGVATQIKQALVNAGGPALEKSVYETKVADGTSILTQIHHRQTPLFLMKGMVSAGVTWKSEALFQMQIGNPIEYVDIQPDQNVSGIYAGAAVRAALHKRAAKEWLDFIASPAALEIFERYGFRPYVAETEASGRN